jgi:hypothetical protein
MSNRWRGGHKPTASLDERWAQLAPLVAEARDHRKRALVGRERIVEDLTATLYREDPIGIACWTPEDEYEPEAETMAIWLLRAKHLDIEYARRRVHEDFVTWFGADVLES